MSKAQNPNCVHISFLCASQCSCRAVCREHKRSAATGGVRSCPGLGLTLDTSAQLLFCSVDLSVVCFVVTAGSQAGYKWGECTMLPGKVGGVIEAASKVTMGCFSSGACWCARAGAYKYACAPRFMGWT